MQCLGYWCHGSTTAMLPRYWPFVRGIHRSPVNSPHKGQWRGALMFTLICARINGWVNNREAGDWRRCRGHYDVTVMPYKIDTLRPRKMADISQTTFSNVFSSIPIQISLKFVPKAPIINIPAMVRIVAWRRPGDTPLSEPMMAILPTYICVTRPQWVNGSLLSRGPMPFHFDEQRKKQICYDFLKWIQ